ncbi:MAG: phenylphosphate synthase subunit beta [Proteobacteria bacterium]|nr:phenylphosphate synthase subunit beta [Pseudomonadota bacterium]MBU1743011.1 phenylphosphate synthase subunit beta [Pseudomonadota bacterium]
MDRQAPLVVWFEDCNKESVPVVGGKNASLGEMINAGIRVPPGFAVTTTAYQRFCDEAGISGDILGALDGLDHQDSAALNQASAAIREMIESPSFSWEFEDHIAEFYRRLAKRCLLPAVPVACRSSATAEDLPGASFAGQQETYLWVRGADNVLDKVRKCFSSLFTPRAIAYRVKMGFPHEQVAISVGVQKMANSFTAGVMFTLNPANGDRSVIVIDSNFGFGESVVSGEVTPDNFVVNKVTLDIIKKTISRKGVYYTVDPETHASTCREIPTERQTAQSTIDDDIIELAKMGKIIEKHYGRPQDIEWAVDKDMPTTGNVMILQSRPETVWSDKKRETGGAPKKSVMDFMLDSMMKGKKIT